MKIYESHPTGSIALPELNATNNDGHQKRHMDEGVVVLEDKAIAILIETNVIMRTILLVVDKVIIMVMCRKGLISKLHKETMSIHKLRRKWQGMMLGHHKVLMVHLIHMVAQAIGHGLVALPAYLY
uniref:Uncharacterized protein n=1 Tax=Lactuca sativa TaxID=4236 RepID=A0A9R1X9N1_LACSA|nr:hypothetical protein LSAT_V11C500252500 [Lactuca sativa]